MYGWFMDGACKVSKGHMCENRTKTDLLKSSLLSSPPILLRWPVRNLEDVSEEP